MFELYNYLRIELGMTSPQAVYNKIHSFNNRKSEELVAKIFKMIKIEIPRNNKSIFNFKANSTFSGGRYPCAELECRIKNLKNLMRFSALYAEEVFISSPFDKYIEQLENGIKINLNDLIIDIIILLELETLVVHKIVKFQSEYICLCSNCSSNYKNDIEVFKKSVDIYYEKLLNECASQIKCELINNGDPEIIVSNLELYGYSYSTVMQFTDYTPDSIAKIINKAGLNEIILNEKEIYELGIPNMILNQSYKDTLVNYLYSMDSNISYLTDRQVDFELLNLLDKDNKSNLHLLDHTLTIVPDVNIEKIVDLRLKDGESFKVYRNTLNKEIKKLRNLSENEMADFYQDIIQPDIDNMNRTLKNHKRNFNRGVVKETLFWGGVLSVGMVSGSFENNLPSEIFNTVGGLGTTYSMYNNYNKFNENNSIENEPYYFLWKLHNINQ